MRLLLLFILMVVPTVGQAAYNRAEIKTVNKQQNGMIRWTFEFTGNGGEEPKQREFLVMPGTTVALVRNWVDETMTELDQLYTIGNLASVQPGQVVPRLARVPSAPTAKDIWMGKVLNYDRSCTNSFVGAVATACASLKSDIESTYQAGFLQD